MSTAPPAPSDTSALLDQAIKVLRGRTTIVLTGAGISTDSGIPDYRGVGAPRAHPMSYQNFMQSPRHRQRYWLGSHLGWNQFSSAKPNLGHTAIATAEASNTFAGVITQNVDALHHKAGSLRVVDVHGRLDRVRCVHCGQSFTRSSIAEKIDALNPWVVGVSLEGPVRPDGDVDVTLVDEFEVPGCDICEGVLKPEVVFFGEFVDPSVFNQAASMVSRSEAVVVAGSSLVVNTGIRLLGIAVKRKLPLVIINRGPTKADHLATVRIEGGTSENLGAIVEALAA